MKKFISLLVAVVVIGYNGMLFTADPDHKDLLDAAAFGDVELTQALIARSADFNITDAGFGETPLHCATRYGHHEVVELLLAHHKDPQSYVTMVDRRGNTPLHCAAFHGDRKIAQFLINTHNNPHSYVAMTTRHGSTALHRAVDANHPDVAQLLIAAHNNPESYVTMTDEDGNTPLHLAAETGRYNPAQLLLAQHSNPEVYINMTNKHGDRALDVAEHNQNVYVGTHFGCTIKLMKHWKQFREGIKSSWLALATAMHRRCGKNSSAQILHPLLAAYICSFLDPKACIYTVEEINKYINTGKVPGKD